MEQSKFAQCLSNLRQIAVGMRMYVDESHGTFPLWANKPYERHRHYVRGRTTVTPDLLAQDGQRFISPILFADGHSSSHDFTHVLKDNPNYPMEPTKDWYWYEPKK